MRLDRLAVRQVFDITTPRWNGGDRVVGINTELIRKHNVINITYTRKDGKRSFPDPFYFDGDRIKKEKFDTQTVSGGVTLLMIPLSTMPAIKTGEPQTVQLTQEQVKQKHPLIYKIFFEDKVKVNKQTDLFKEE